ncbi:MAG: acetate kinase, partial [Clostridium sp.]|nr:acetate kinase [Clostridium sp.]
EYLCEHLGYLGVKFDAEANKARGKEVVISAPDSKVTVVVIPTDEEMVIAQDTAAIVSKI